jgi:hypothetical protein
LSEPYSCSKLADDVEYRLEVAEQLGVGFAVPTMIPMIPRKSPKEKEKAAA